MIGHAVFHYTSSLTTCCDNKNRFFIFVGGNCVLIDKRQLLLKPRKQRWRKQPKTQLLLKPRKKRRRKQPKQRWDMLVSRRVGWFTSFTIFELWG